MSVGCVGGCILRVQTVRECQTERVGKVSAAAYLPRIAETNVTTVEVLQTDTLRCRKLELVIRDRPMTAYKTVQALGVEYWS